MKHPLLADILANCQNKHIQYTTNGVVQCETTMMVE